MRALIQRVTSASVAIQGEDAREHGGTGDPITRSIGKGYVILLGVGHEDTLEVARKLWEKVWKLRIFEDADGKTNLSLADVEGEVLLVSQFTLYANCKKGNRPSFTQAGKPDAACALYEQFASLVRASGVPVQTGWFGAHMSVALENDGPFTIWLDTDAL